MKEYKVGGKITLEDKKCYRIIEIFRFNEKDYLFCCTTEKPIIPKLFEKIEENGKIFVKPEEDLHIMKEVTLKILDGEI